MATRLLTGSRIRERRLILGKKQADLAREAGISSAYLNLIEHNRRRIGGAVLGRIADALGVDVASLTEGAEGEILQALEEAASAAGAAGPEARRQIGRQIGRQAGSQTGPQTAGPVTAAEVDRAEDFASRFPGWAALVRTQMRRIRSLEHTVEELSDRMAHDPHLAASLHDVLTTVAAIGSAASILTETEEIEAEWRDRFHRNIFEDSQRLAQASARLVSYLEDEDGGEGPRGGGAPQDEVEAWMAARGYRVPELEAQGTGAEVVEALLAQARLSPSAAAIAWPILTRLRADAAVLPLSQLRDLAQATGYDPLQMAQAAGISDIALVLRRMAQLPPPEGASAPGLAICDASGTLTYRQPVPGFALPRFGACCPLWPLFQTLARPMVPERRVIETAGRDRTRFLAYAIAQPVGPSAFGAAPRLEATMLILPPDLVALPEAVPVDPVGMSCRICAQPGCAARREPSVLSDGAVA